MNYLLQGQPFKYVYGECQPYETITTQNDGHGRQVIKSYGALSDAALLELACMAFDSNDKMLKAFVKKTLADKFNIKLRAQPMSTKKMLNYYED
jgi:hypothetical protein